MTEDVIIIDLKSHFYVTYFERSLYKNIQSFEYFFSRIMRPSYILCNQSY